MDYPERLFIEGKCDDTILQICKDAGWLEDINKLIPYDWPGKHVDTKSDKEESKEMKQEVIKPQISKKTEEKVTASKTAQMAPNTKINTSKTNKSTVGKKKK